jgi:hypothetical protein
VSVEPTSNANTVRLGIKEAPLWPKARRFAEETLENTFDFAHKLVRMKEPQEIARIQTEFFSRQAQVLAGSGQRILQDVNDVAKTTLEGAAESPRRRSEAA